MSVREPRMAPTSRSGAVPRRMSGGPPCPLGNQAPSGRLRPAPRVLGGVPAESPRGPRARNRPVRGTTGGVRRRPGALALPFWGGEDVESVVALPGGLYAPGAFGVARLESPPDSRAAGLDRIGHIRAPSHAPRERHVRVAGRPRSRPRPRGTVRLPRWLLVRIAIRLRALHVRALAEIAGGRTLDRRARRSLPDGFRRAHDDPPAPTRRFARSRWARAAGW